MTADASLPPADVQCPEPPLTEAEWIRDALWRGNPLEDAAEGEAALDRLIADLRASRAAWVPVCDACGQQLEQPGALLFGPPDDSGNVSKEHFCVACYAEMHAARARIKELEEWITNEGYHLD